MKEKIKLIVLIVIFIGLLILVNSMLNNSSTPQNISNLSNVTTSENVDLNQNIAVQVTNSSMENNSENQASKDLENNIEDTTNEAGIVTEVTESTFDEEVLKSDKTVLIDFYASWCNPCKVLSPIVEEVAKENPNIKVVKIDVDANQNLSNEYRAYSIPTLVVIKNGKEVNRSVGVIPKEYILDLVK